jgi:hypothetical protein
MASSNNISPVKSTKSRSNDPLEKYVIEIDAAWRKSVANILDVASLCLKAYKELAKSDRKTLAEKLHFGPAMFSKMLSIAKYEPFTKPEVRDAIPEKFSLMYAISQLPPEVTMKALNDNQITLKTKRKQIEGLKTQNAIASPATAISIARKATGFEMAANPSSTYIVRLRGNPTKNDLVELAEWVEHGRALKAVETIATSA